MTTDLLVVGAGPAGVSAALWARSLHVSVVVLERGARPGGQLHAIHDHPRELPGLAPGDGPALAEGYAAQLAEAGIEVRCDLEASALESRGDEVSVRVGSRGRVAARSLLIATGLRRSRLDVPGEAELEGRGVSTSSTRDRARLAGGDVVVVGGGDAAFENALLLAEVGCRVTVVIRGAPRARAEFRARVGAESRIEVIEDMRVVAIVGEDRVRAVRLEGRGGALERAASGVVVKIGSRPNTQWCRAAVACDPDGYVIADARGRTSRARVWAAGDVTRPALPSLSVAYGNAALAVADLRVTLAAGA